MVVMISRNIVTKDKFATLRVHTVDIHVTGVNVEEAHIDHCPKLATDQHYPAKKQKKT